MLKAGTRRDVLKVAGDATQLPFGDETFDAVTISFGLRNVVDTDAGLREMARVTKPVGRLVVCEFSTPTVPVFATVYKEYLMRALPADGPGGVRDPESYEYLAESIRAWPDQSALARRIGEAGWSAVRWRNLSGGHRGPTRRPQSLIARGENARSARTVGGGRGTANRHRRPP